MKPSNGPRAPLMRSDASAECPLLSTAGGGHLPAVKKKQPVRRTVPTRLAADSAASSNTGLQQDGLTSSNLAHASFSASAAIFAAAAGASDGAIAAPSTPPQPQSPQQQREHRPVVWGSPSPLGSGSNRVVDGSRSSTSAASMPDSYSEQELLGASHEYIYTRLAAAGHLTRAGPSTLPPHQPNSSSTSASPNEYTSASTPHRGRSGPARVATPSFGGGDLGLGRDRCDFVSPVECRIFNLRESMRDDFARLFRTFKNSKGFAAASSANAAVEQATLESAMVRFVSEAHPANFFWFALEIFVTELLNQWSGVELLEPAAAGLTATNPSFAHMSALQMRMTQPATSSLPVTFERKPSGAGLNAPTVRIMSATPQAYSAATTPRNKSAGQSFRPTNTIRSIGPSHLAHSNGSSAHSLYGSFEPIAPSSRFPAHLAFSFSSESSLALAFPDRQEFFARFLLVACEHSTSLATHLRNALTMKLHQLNDLGAWRFTDSAGVDLARTWHGRILKSKLLAKFLALILALPQTDVTRMALMGGGGFQTSNRVNSDGTPQYERSHALTNIAFASTAAINVLTFPPFSNLATLTHAKDVADILSLPLLTPAFAFPLQAYLTFSRATESLSLFVPWICSFLRMYKFDLIGLHTEYVQNLLLDLAELHAEFKQKMAARQPVATSLNAAMQRTFSSPLITSPASFRHLIGAPASAGQHSVAPTAALLLPVAASGFTTPTSRSQAPPPQIDDLNASLEALAFETAVTPPLSPRSTADASPFLFPPGSGGFVGTPQQASPQPASAIGSSPSSVSLLAAASVTRALCFLAYEIEELFEWLELDLAACAEERRKKPRSVTDERMRRQIEAAIRAAIAVASTVDGPSVASHVPTSISSRERPAPFVEPAVPPRAQRSLLKDLTSSTAPTLSTAPSSSAASVFAAAAAGAATARPASMVTLADSAVSNASGAPTRKALASSVGSQVTSMTATDVRTIALDSVVSLIPNNLFLSLLTSSHNATRKEELRAIVNGADPLVVAHQRRKASIALSDVADGGGALADGGTVQPPNSLRRTMSMATGQRRKITPMNDSTTPAASSKVSANDSSTQVEASLAKLRVDFFKMHPALSPLVRFISDNLERHILTGEHHCVATPIAERVKEVLREFERSVTEHIAHIDVTKDVTELDRFLASLADTEKRLIATTITPLKESIIAGVTVYLESSSLQALRALASPSLHPGVLQTAALLTTSHSLAAVRSGVVKKITTDVRIMIEKWMAKMKKLWEAKKRAWLTQPTSASPITGSPIVALDSASPSTMADGLQRDESQVENEVADRVQHARRVFAELSTAPAPVAASTALLPLRTTSQRMLHVLMPLSICLNAASHSVSSSGASPSFRAFFDDERGSESGFFHEAITVLTRAHQQHAAQLSAATLPNEYEQCWTRLGQIYRIVRRSSAGASVLHSIASLSLPPAVARDLEERVRRIVGER